MKADGSVYIDTRMDTKGISDGAEKIEKQFEGMASKTKEAAKAIRQITEAQAKKMPLVKEAAELGAKLDEAKAKLYDLQKQRASAKSAMSMPATGNQTAEQVEAWIAANTDLPDIESKIATQEAEIDALQKKWDSVNVKIDQYNQKIQEANASMNNHKAKTEQSANAAGTMKRETRSAAAETEKLGQKAGKVSQNMSAASKSMRRFNSRLGEIVRGALFFNIISSGLRTMVNGMWQAIAAQNNVQQALANLTGAAYTAAAPLINVLANAFVAVANAAAVAFSYISRLYALLTGKSLKVVAAQGQAMGNLSAAAGGVANNVKKAKRALAGFDEIQKLSFPEESGGGGGGGGGLTPNFDFGLTDEWSESANTLLDIIGSIAAALAGLKIGQLLSDLGVGNNRLEMMLGSALALSGAFLLAKGSLSSFMDGLNKTNFLEQIFGSAELVAGATLIGKSMGNALMGGAIGGIVASVPMLFSGVYDAMANGMNSLNAALIPIATTLAGASIGALFGPVGLGIGGLLGLVMGLIGDFQIWSSEKTEQSKDEFLESLAELPLQTDAVMVGPMQDIIGNLFKWIKGESPKVSDKIVKDLSTAGARAEKFFTTPTKKSLADLFSKASRDAGSTSKSIIEAFGSAKSETDLQYVLPTQEGFTSLFNWLKQGFTENKNHITKMAQDAMFGQRELYLTPTKTNFSELFSFWKTKFSETKQNIIQAFQSARQGVTDGFSNPVRTETASLSSTISGYFANTGASISSAFSNAAANVRAAFSGLASWFSSNVVGPITQMLNSLAEAIANLIARAQSAWDSISSGNDSVTVNKPGSGSRPIKGGNTNRLYAKGGTIRDWGIVGEAGYPELVEVIGGKAVVTPLPYLSSGTVAPPRAASASVAEMRSKNVTKDDFQNAFEIAMEDIIKSNTAGQTAIISVLRDILEAVLGIDIDGETINNAVESYRRKMAVVRGG